MIVLFSNSVDPDCIETKGFDVRGNLIIVRFRSFPIKSFFHRAEERDTLLNPVRPGVHTPRHQKTRCYFSDELLKIPSSKRTQNVKHTWLVALEKLNHSIDESPLARVFLTEWVHVVLLPVPPDR